MLNYIINKIFRKLGFPIIDLKYSNIQRDPFLDQKMLIGSRSNLVIFDVGGHHGQTAIKYAEIFNDAIVYTFEPFKDSFDILSDKVRNSPSIKAYNTALGYAQGQVNFHINKFSATNSILPTHKDAANSWSVNLLDTVSTTNVKITTIDSFISINNIEKIDILKIDTQGSEYAVIEGGLQAIGENRVKLIYLEIITVPTYENQKYFDEMLALLRIHNFRLFNFYDISSTDEGQLRQVDALFINDGY